MADIETSVVISAQTDDLQSGMEAATNSVQVATDAMRTQLAGLGASAQQAQSQISTAAAQVGSSIGALQSKAASLAGSIGDSLTPDGGIADNRNFARGPARSHTTSLRSGGAGADNVSAWRAELQEQLLAEQSFFGQSKSEELAFWQDKLALTEAGSNATSMSSKSSSPSKPNATSSTSSRPIRRSQMQNSPTTRRRSMTKPRWVKSRLPNRSASSRTSSTSNGLMTRPITRRSSTRPKTMCGPSRS